MRQRELRLVLLFGAVLLLLAAGCDGRAAAPTPAEPDLRDDAQDDAQDDAPSRPDTGPEADAAIRTVITAYLGSVAVPAPPKFDPEHVAQNVLAAWSSGKTYEGREAFLRALQAGIDEVGTLFDSLEVAPERLIIRRGGEAAWVYTRFSMSGVLKQGRIAFTRTNHATFVLERRESRWQIVHELSSRLPE